MKRNMLVITIGGMIGATAIALGWLVLPENFLGVFVIFGGLMYCIGGSLFLAFGRPPQRVVNAPSSDRTLLYLVPGALLVLLASPLEYHYLLPALPRGPLLPWLGILLLTSGLALRLWTRQVLKDAYQGNLQVQPGQQLITGGPYSWVRHPGYLAFLIMAGGLALGFSSLTGLLGVGLLATGFYMRIQVEEQMLYRAFGQQYIDYAQRTGCVLPLFQRRKQE